MQKCTSLLAAALGVPNLLLGPIYLIIFCLLGRDTGLCRNPFAKTPFSWVPTVNRGFGSISLIFVMHRMASAKEPCLQSWWRFRPRTKKIFRSPPPPNSPQTPSQAPRPPLGDPLPLPEIFNKPQPPLLVAPDSPFHSDEQKKIKKIRNVQPCL